MLDSSPVALPPVPRPLKRSASVASLPTPPRTRHKGKGVRTDAKYDTDTDGGSSASENEADGDDDKLVFKPKKQRTSLKSAVDDDEEAFWMDSGSKAKSDTELELDPTKSQKAKASSSKSATRPAPLLYRRGTGSTGIAPVSPPPSNRRKAAATATLNLPVTPKIKKPILSSSSPTTPRLRPLRDTPDNPFLVTPGENKSRDSTPPLPRTPKKERPTVTYVFRGVRGTFPNPLYDHKNDKPLSPSHNSELPVEHPDFSPSSHCVPKLLFPEARKLRPRKNREGPSSPSPKPRRDTLSQELDRALERERARNLTVKKGKRGSERGRSASWSDDEDDVAAKGEDARLVPMKLNFTTETKESKDGKKT